MPRRTSPLVTGSIHGSPHLVAWRTAGWKIRGQIFPSLRCGRTLIGSRWSRRASEIRASIGTVLEHVNVVYRNPGEWRRVARRVRVKHMIWRIALRRIIVERVLSARGAVCAAGGSCIAPACLSLIESMGEEGAMEWHQLPPATFNLKTVKHMHVMSSFHREDGKVAEHLIKRAHQTVAAM